MHIHSKFFIVSTLIMTSILLLSCPDSSSSSDGSDNPDTPDTPRIVYKPDSPVTEQAVFAEKDLSNPSLFTASIVKVANVTEASITIGETAYTMADSKITLVNDDEEKMDIGFSATAGIDYNALADTFAITISITTAEGTYTKSVEVEKAKAGDIYNWRDLQAMKDDLTIDYVLKNDIVFPEPGEEGFPEYGFVPIGYDIGINSNDFEGTAFSGSLDGNGHVIRNFFIDATYEDWITPNAIYDGVTLDDQHIGLFGKVQRTAGNAVQNLTIELRAGTAIHSVDNYVGGVTGRLQAGTLSNVAVTGGTIKGSQYIGGLVGLTEGTVIGYATGEVSGSQYVGGLVGFNNSGTIIGYATGKVLGTDNDIGGLVGYNNGTFIGYATGEISGPNKVGGLIGLSANSDNSGGYWDIAASGQAASAGRAAVIGVSATKNIVYASGTYTDSGKSDAAIFDAADFTNIFDTTAGAGKTWPKLKTAFTVGDTDYTFPLKQPTVSDSDGDDTIEVVFP